MIDLKYYPVSTDVTPTLYTISSMTSLFDNKYTIPEQISDTDSACPSKTQATHTVELPDTVLHQNNATVTTNIAPPSNIVTVDELTTGSTGTGYVDSPLPKSTFNKELYSTLDLEMDTLNDCPELAFSGSNSPVLSDAHAGRHTPSIDPYSGDATGTATSLLPATSFLPATSLSLKQSSDFISEDLLVSSHTPVRTFDLDDPVYESEPRQSVGVQNISHDKQSLTFSTEEAKTQECFQTNMQSCPGYIPNTHLPRSVERNTDALGCQILEGPSSPSVNGRDHLMKSPPHLFSPSSPQHCRTRSEGSLEYFNYTMRNQLNSSSLSQSQYLSASGGYVVIDGSLARENGQTLPSTTCSFALE